MIVLHAQKLGLAAGTQSYQNSVVLPCLGPEKPFIVISVEIWPETSQAATAVWLEGRFWPLMTSSG